MQINPVYYATVDISSIQPVFVSRMPRHKVTGAAHEETIRSQVNEKYTAVRKSITELSLDKDGKIKDYFKPSSDTLLYEALKKRLTEFGGNAKKAFAEPFYKPRADGTPGAQVQSEGCRKNEQHNSCPQRRRRCKRRQHDPYRCVLCPR